VLGYYGLLAVVVTGNSREQDISTTKKVGSLTQEQRSGAPRTLCTMKCLGWDTIASNRPRGKGVIACGNKLLWTWLHKRRSGAPRTLYTVRCLGWDTIASDCLRGKGVIACSNGLPWTWLHKRRSGAPRTLCTVRCWGWDTIASDCHEGKGVKACKYNDRLKSLVRKKISSGNVKSHHKQDILG
jgi:hypothetical protein